jgi:hypothetical protein
VGTICDGQNAALETSQPSSVINIEELDTCFPAQGPDEVLAGVLIDNSTIEPQPGADTEELETPCRYHSLIIALARANEHREERGGKVNRYLAADPAKQSALFVKGDSGRLSIDKACTCETIGPELEISEDEEELVRDNDNKEQQEDRQRL